MARGFITRFTKTRPGNTKSNQFNPHTMMKEKQIRAIIPFITVFGITFFLADAKLFHDFGNRFEIVKDNMRLVWLLVTGDVGQAVIWFGSSLIFFLAWNKNKKRTAWYTDMYWQLSGVFFCWFVLSVLSLISNFVFYLWLQGLVRLCVFIFGFYFFNTLYAARKLMYYPETREEALRKAQKFDELLKKLRDE